MIKIKSKHKDKREGEICRILDEIKVLDFSKSPNLDLCQIVLNRKNSSQKSWSDSLPTLEEGLLASSYIE